MFEILLLNTTMIIVNTTVLLYIAYSTFKEVKKDGGPFRH